MSEIIRKWLTMKLGIILDFNLMSFGDIVKDGTLISQLLYNYGIISFEELESISSTDQPEKALENMMYLNKYFVSLGISYSRKKLMAIANGESLSALKLFYQLYLILNDKNKLYYITNQITKPKDDINNNVDIINVEVQEEKPDQDKSGLDVYNWYRNKFVEQVQRCKEIREKYVKQFEESIKNRYGASKTGIKESITEPITKSSSGSIGIQSEIKDEIPTIDNFDVSDYGTPSGRVITEECQPNLPEARALIQSLKRKTDKFIEEKNLQKALNKMFLNNMFQNLIESQKQEFENDVTSKLLKQSYYERQMETKLLEIRHQKNIIKMNKKLQNELILKRRDEEFISQLHQQKYNITFANLRNENERKRILELHKKIYTDKCKRRYQKHFLMCSKIVNDLMDLICKTIKYKDDFDTEVPQSLWNDWMSLFCAEKSLVDDVENVEDIIEPNATEEDKDLAAEEIEKQNILDANDLENYLKSEWPWNLDETIDYYINSYLYIKLGEEVLCYIIYKLLKAKYPLPPPPKAPLLPPVLTACCLIGDVDDTLEYVLNVILQKKGIFVITINTAINYCLNAYTHERNLFLLDANNVEDTKAKAKPKKEKVNKKEKLPKGKKEKSLSKSTKDEGGYVKEMEFKETQTPRYFPGEALRLSETGKLGEYASESLNLGLPLNEHLLAAIFIGYLKSLSNIKGWVLLNYPENPKAAAALETALTGQIYKYDSEEDEVDEEELCCLREEDSFAVNEDINAEYRVSKFFPNPSFSDDEKKKKSYLSSFIYLIKNPEITLDYIKEAAYVKDYSAVLKFYETFGCQNSLNYVSIIPEVIRDVVSLITKDEIFAMEMYDEIVETVIKYTEEKLKMKAEAEKGGKKGKDKKEKKEKGGKKEKDKKKGKESTVIETQAAVVEEVAPPVPEIVEPPPKPGEPKWKYANLPQPEEIKVHLASFWENVEDIYLNDFKQVFFLKRIYQNAIIPYVYKINTHMIEYIQRPDKKQEYLFKFQKIYNGIENDLRDDDEFKAELHCRITEFKTKLWDICIVKMRDSENERSRIINENWFYEHVTALINIFCSALQLEIDRTLSTFQFLQDYYTSMVTFSLPESKFSKCSLTLYISNEKDATYLISTYTDINNDITNNPFVPFLNSILSQALSGVSSWSNQILNNCKKIDSAYGSTKPDAKKDKKKKLAAKDPSHLANLAEIIDVLIPEWQCAIEGEHLRVKYRILLLIAKAKQDVNELLMFGETLFHDLYTKIEERYHQELKSVSSVCEIFSKAVEACERIQPRLVLDGADFYISKTEILYDDTFEIPVPPKEKISNTYFTLEQLSELTDIFLKLAPHGSLPTKAFVYIFEDIVAHYPQNNESVLLPVYWSYLEPDKVQEVLGKIYGNVEYVNWKDFIIYNLELPFPTELEILEMRQLFRDIDQNKTETIDPVNFRMIHFWFENKEIQLKCPRNFRKVKDILVKMFTVRDNEINYANLLLSFCKDFQPVVGVAKAFCLSIGKLICWNEETGRNYIELLRYQKFVKERERLDAISAAESTMETLLDKTIGSYGSLGLQEPEPEDQIYNEDRTSILLDEVCEEESRISHFPELYYFLPLDAVLAVLITSLPWHYRVQCTDLNEYFEIIYESARNEEFGQVFSHELLNSEQFLLFLENNFKFNAISPAELIEHELEICKCIKEAEVDLSL